MPPLQDAKWPRLRVHLRGALQPPGCHDQAVQQNADLNVALLIAQQKPDQWEQGMAIHTSDLAAISAAVRSAAA